MFSSNNSQVSNDAVFVEDIFSTYLYTGNGSTQTITNGIDLAGKGGLVWLKSRSLSAVHTLVDTARGAGKTLFSDLTNSEATNNAVSAFNANGFTMGSYNNSSGDTYASWTFREQPKFFDIVTYTGNGVAGTQIPHSLGSTPGCIIVKRYAGPGGAVDWAVWHNQLGGSEYLKLNTTNAGITNAAYPPFGAVTSTYFTVGNASATGNNGLTNSNGDSFVAYVFAHNAGGFGLTGTDNVISCGFYMGTGSPVNVNLGYEAQWVMIKRIDGAGGNWYLMDTMRGMAMTDALWLYPNLSDAEVDPTSAQCNPTATGFTVSSTGSGINAGGGAYIYIAIRRGPMKVPTSGTSVFAPTAATQALNSNTSPSAGFPVDTQWLKTRNATDSWLDLDRLRGSAWLVPNATDAEYALSGYIAFDSMTSVRYTNNLSSASVPYIFYNFKRAPSFFDEVCYTGDGTSNRVISHNLGVVPELIINRPRNYADYWEVYHKDVGLDSYFYLNSTAAPASNPSNWSTMTSSVFGAGYAYSHNSTGRTYVTYLFASCAGVSKVGSYTGDGTVGRVIDCGFTSGARFIMLKKTSTTSDWYVYDTARGIVSGGEKSLSLNTTAAESGSSDVIDPDSSGFAVGTGASDFFNESGVTYIYLAIA